MTGIIIRKTGDTIDIEEYLVDTADAIIETGTTTLYLFWLDGTTQKYFDWGTDTFVTTGGSTSTTMAYKDVNSLGTGLWLKQITTLTAFTSNGAGQKYRYKIHSDDGNWGADILGEFIYGGHDGDLTAAKVAFIDKSIAALNDIDGSTVTATSVTDKTGYSISGSKQTLDALNDIDGSSVTVAGASEDSIVDKVWDEIISGHAVSGSTAELLTIIAGLMGKNLTIHPTYTDGKLLGSTIRIFDTKAHTDDNYTTPATETGMIDKFTTTQAFDSNDVDKYKRTDYS